MSVNLFWRSFRDSTPPRQQNNKLDNGGTIGRSDSNNFVVYDPENFASRHHARIFIHQGAWYIEDTSSAGTIINNQIQLHKGQTHLIKHGDVLTIGECDIELHFDHQTTPPTPPHQKQANQSHNQNSAPGSTFDISDFFTDMKPKRPQNQQSDNQCVKPPNIPFTHITDAIQNQNEEKSNVENSELDEVTPKNNSNLENHEDTMALRAFLSELNLDPNELIGRNKTDIMRVAGILLRTLTEGMMDVLKSREEVKSQFHMDTTQIQNASNNPLKFSIDSTDAMAKMLKQEEGYMDPIKSANEAVNDARAHQLAMLSGLEATILATINAFDPKELQKEFDRNMGFTLSKSSKYWHHFQEEYEKIASSTQTTSNNLFSQEFKAHYEKQIREFKTTRT